NPTEPEECVIKVPEKAALLNLLKTGEDKWGTLMKFVRARSFREFNGPLQLHTYAAAGLRPKGVG
ncbi:MAG TPA: hypothetical protein VM682_00815, partial [Bacillus sp. (in: firmicutes)]|nr:hypothetical protein [Bacillus sp. (in: firmicutes)]